MGFWCFWLFWLFMAFSFFVYKVVGFTQLDLTWKLERGELHFFFDMEMVIFWGFFCTRWVVVVVMLA
ncbi:hypothetical protein BZA05DRAFT_391669 [Tricharina praecox]|uniref:uncharacterized protein n=1 Tax=Tricharina praecox TaxID=43433 RepID=UPI00221FCCA8|nr:uncharacterized protein BZA05DRAFT_391669 [Tricharina praecox]KAI5855473.1 hypothetical protein BZA05DRAFT_391669 [Tricharina praecox]